jgi:hypothetical protein
MVLETKLIEYEVGRTGLLQLGDSVILFPDGKARLGDTVFAPDCPIDDHYFAEGHRARRRIDDLRYLYLKPPNGPERIYRYGYRCWYRLVPYVRRRVELADVVRFCIGALAFGVWLAAIYFSTQYGDDKITSLILLIGVVFYLFRRPE